jgi:hypothetical protein
MKLVIFIMDFMLFLISLEQLHKYSKGEIKYFPQHLFSIFIFIAFIILFIIMMIGEYPKV